MQKKAGFIGVGALGGALLERLLLAGVPTTVYDIAADRMSAAAALGAQTADSPAAAARGADFVHVCVRTDDEMLDATLSERGVLNGMEPSAIAILHSTILPETTQRIAQVASARGIRVVDATVVGQPHVARAGDQCFLIGGPDEVVREVTPHLQAMGRAVYHFGPLGAGNVAKIAKNLATAADRVLMSEIVAIGEAGGLDPRRLLDMMRVEYEPLTRNWERAFAIENGHAALLPSGNLLDKDIQHAAHFAAAHGVNAPVTQAAADSGKAMVAAWKSRSGAAVAS